MVWPHRQRIILQSRIIVNGGSVLLHREWPDLNPWRCETMRETAPKSLAVMASLALLTETALDDAESWP